MMVVAWLLTQTQQYIDDKTLVDKAQVTSQYHINQHLQLLHWYKNNWNKCKKRSLSHQLTAQLHIENSKNKKMVITLLQHIA